MKKPKKRKNDIVDLTVVQPYPFRRAPELHGKLKCPPEKLARAKAFYDKFGLPPYD